VKAPWIRFFHEVSCFAQHSAYAVTANTLFAGLSVDGVCDCRRFWHSSHMDNARTICFYSERNNSGLEIGIVKILLQIAGSNTDLTAGLYNQERKPKIKVASDSTASFDDLFRKALYPCKGFQSAKPYRRKDFNSTKTDGQRSGKSMPFCSTLL